MAGGRTVVAARARVRPARNRTQGVSNEAKRSLGRHVSALDPLADASRYGRHRPWDFEGRALKHCADRPRGLAVRDARARRTAIGARHHAARRVDRGPPVASSSSGHSGRSAGSGASPSSSRRADCGVCDARKAGHETPWCRYFRPSFFPAASSETDSRMRLARVSGRFAM